MKTKSIGVEAMVNLQQQQIIDLQQQNQHINEMLQNMAQRMTAKYIHQRVSVSKWAKLLLLPMTPKYLYLKHLNTKTGIAEDFCYSVPYTLHPIHPGSAPMRLKYI